MATQKNIIDQVFPETLKILSDLIKFPTVSGTSNLKLIEYCENKLSKLEAKSFKTINESTQQANLFSTISGEKKANDIEDYIKSEICSANHSKRSFIASFRR